MTHRQDKLIIVEGKTDKEKIIPLMDESVEIICTYGTLGFEQMEEMLDYLENRDVYILVDADDAGNDLRRQLRSELPNATHLYVKKMHKEVARTPADELKRILENAHFCVVSDDHFLFEEEKYGK